MPVRPRAETGVFRAKVPLLYVFPRAGNLTVGPGAFWRPLFWPVVFSGWAYEQSSRSRKKVQGWSSHFAVWYAGRSRYELRPDRQPSGQNPGVQLLVDIPEVTPFFPHHGFIDVGFGVFEGHAAMLHGDTDEGLVHILGHAFSISADIEIGSLLDPFPKF